MPELTQRIKECGEKYQQYLIDTRRYFHQHPEPSLQETETAKKIKEELESFGIPCHFVGTPCHNGVVGTIEGGKPGRTIMLRADIDALKIQEETDCSFSSLNPGVMHACGHDCHIALLLTAARILTDIREELCGSVRLVFQPAEEFGVGAGMLIADGVLDGVDACYGSHVWSSLPSGTIAVAPCPVMAAGSRFEVFVKGKGAHGAEPHKGVDPLLTTAAIAMNLQSIVSREIDTQAPSVLSIGRMQSGSQYNAIPAEGYLEGTTRTFSPEVDLAWADMIRRVVENTAAAYRAEAELVYHYILGPVLNDAALAELVCESVRKVGGPELLGAMKPTTTSEDFSEYQKLVPGVLAFIGVGSEACGAVYPQHSNHYKVDESALLNGALLYAQVAADYLR